MCYYRLCSLVKQGDNVLGSIRLSVRALTPELLTYDLDIQDVGRDCRSRSQVKIKCQKLCFDIAVTLLQGQRSGSRSKVEVERSGSSSKVEVKVTGQVQRSRSIF